MFEEKTYHKDSVFSPPDLNVLNKIILPDCQEEISDIILIAPIRSEKWFLISLPYVLFNENLFRCIFVMLPINNVINQVRKHT